MKSSMIKAVKFSSTVLIFIIVISSITAESLRNVFMRIETNVSNTNFLFLVSSVAILATFIIVSLFNRNRQLTLELNNRDLSGSNDAWEKTFNMMTEFVSVHDKNFRIIKANKALCDFLGKSSEEIIGKLCYQLFHNMDEPIAGCPHQKTSETGHPVTEIINDPNIGVPLQVICTPFFNDDDTVQGSVHIARVYEPSDKKNTITEEIIPICASCKNIRKEKHTWVTPEDYFIKKYGAKFTHSICKKCREKLYPDFIYKG